MKLKRLIIQGFKSFKDRTTVNFDDGITGIVGPNGCGKSNIVDALFWIMGEMSAKHLRGDSMKDLIFAGSSKYSPATWAEATLVLENTEGKHIHIGNKVSSPSEIQLTRKLYRNSETEYRINGQPCRLRDIQEVFMDTGAGAKSYSIIAQGEINRLVQAKPEERRTMIEEVAGITKFKKRKRESVKKIEATQANLARLNDLQIEIEKNLRLLQKQAEKAERARNLKEKIKRNDLVVHSHKVFELLKGLREAKSALNEGRISLENWRTRKSQLEVGLEEERIQKDIQTTKIEEMQVDYNEHSKKLAAAEERLGHLCDNQSQKEKLIEEKEKEIVELNNDLEERNERLEQVRTQRDSILTSKNEETNFEELEEKINSMQEELEGRNIQIRELEEELSTHKESLHGIEGEEFKNTSKLEEYASSLQDITLEIEALEKQYSGVSTEIADERDEVNTAEGEVNKLSSELERIQSEYSEKSSLLKEEKSKLDELIKEQIQTESRKESLIEIKKSLEGAKEGISEFLASDSSERYHLFGDKVECDQKYASAVQSLLGDLLNSLIQEESENTELLKWIAKSPEKMLEYIKPESLDRIGDCAETIERLKLMDLEEIVSVADILNISNIDTSSLKPMLKGYYIADKLTPEHIEKLNSGINFKGIVSLDGKTTIRNLGGALGLEVAGNEDQENSIVARNNKISELTEELENLNYSVEKLQNTHDELTKDVELLLESQDQLRAEYLTAKENYVSKKSALESKVSNYENSNTRLDILKNRKSEISKSRLDLLEKADYFQDKTAQTKDIVENLSEQLENAKEQQQLFSQNYESERNEFLKAKAEADTYKERLEGVDSQIIDIEKQIERSKEKISANEKQVETYGEEVKGIEEELSNLEKDNLDLAEVLKTQEEGLTVLKDQLANLLSGMKEREDEVKDLNTRINKVDKELVEHEMRIEQNTVEEEQIVRDIFERHQIDLRHCIGNFLEFEEVEYEGLNDLSTMFVMETEDGPKEIKKNTYEFNRRYGQDLKDCQYKLKQYKNEYNRLGEINWKAIEDYDRQKLRFEFLNAQETELKQSLEDLQLAIDQIDNKSKMRFKLAFEEVNERFKKVFPIIFGGGTAHLKVIGDLDSPDCGVDIIAQPPGKKMQNINLMSGGEKALTAVSLIFSIFLVKPSPFCLLDEVDAPLDDANVGRFTELLREMSKDSQFILITHNKKTMELNDTLYGVTMQEPGISKAVSVQLH